MSSGFDLLFINKKSISIQFFSQDFDCFPFLLRQVDELLAKGVNVTVYNGQVSCTFKLSAVVMQSVTISYSIFSKTSSVKKGKKWTFQELTVDDLSTYYVFQDHMMLIF